MDPFETQSQSLTAPIRAAAPVTPDDAADLAVLPRALYIGAPGDLTLTLAEGQTVTFQALPEGTVLPVRAARVHASGTTAGAILSLW